MGCTVVRGAARTAELDERGLTGPTFRGVFLGPAGVPARRLSSARRFFAGLEVSGLAAGIVAAAAVAALLYLHERQAGRDGLLVRLSLAFVAGQSLVGLLSHSATVYLAQPVLTNAIWGAAFLVSVALGRPLAGVLACAWYPFPPSFRETEAFKRVFGIESLVWGLGFLTRSGIRLNGAVVRRARERSRHLRPHRAAGDDPARSMVGAIRNPPPRRRSRTSQDRCSTLDTRRGPRGKPVADVIADRTRRRPACSRQNPRRGARAPRRERKKCIPSATAPTPGTRQKRSRSTRGRASSVTAPSIWQAAAMRRTRKSRGYREDRCSLMGEEGGHPDDRGVPADGGAARDQHRLARIRPRDPQPRCLRHERKHRRVVRVQRRARRDRVQHPPAPQPRQRRERDKERHGRVGTPSVP